MGPDSLKILEGRAESSLSRFLKPMLAAALALTMTGCRESYDQALNSPDKQSLNSPADQSQLFKDFAENPYLIVSTLSTLVKNGKLNGATVKTEVKTDFDSHTLQYRPKYIYTLTTPEGLIISSNGEDAKISYNGKSRVLATGEGVFHTLRVISTLQASSR